MDVLNTFSIVAHDAEEQAWGVAVASKFLAAGALVNWARAGVGAVATQAFARVGYGPQGLDLMAQGYSAEEAVSTLLAGDPDTTRRQVACVDAQGRVAAYTGPDCIEWAGHCLGSNYSCQGNLLTGPDVVDAMSRAFERVRGQLATRLFAALVAGNSAGGDRRGKQSAALLVVRPGGGYGGDTDRYLDLRVDDDPDPLRKLSQLLRLHQLYFGDSAPEQRLSIDEELAAELQTMLVEQGYYHGPINGTWDEASIAAFWQFVSTENLEERWNPGDAYRLDPVILNFVRERF